MAEKLNKDTVYRTAKPKEKDYSISDGNGLSLHINTKSSKLWRFVYTFEGKRCKMAFGNYPATSLELARKKADVIKCNTYFMFIILFINELYINFCILFGF